MASYRPSALFDLSGRIALVTGGGTGIGLKMTTALAASGAKVYITGRRIDVLQKVASEWDREIGGEVVALQMDVGSKESIIAARDFIKEKEGRLHILINNAGQPGPIFDDSGLAKKDGETLGQALFDHETFEDWADLYRINTFAIFFVTTAFLGLLEKGSQDVPGYWSNVVNITSICGITRLGQNHMCYNASKAAASHLTKMFAAETGQHGIPIRVNSVAPGLYESEITGAKIEPEQVDSIIQGVHPVPAKRVGRGEEIAGTVLYLVSKAGGYTTGVEIATDGGYLAVNP